MAIEELFSLFTNGRARQEVTSATVVRVSPDGVWVHIEGGADDTPVKGSYSDVSVGDVVSVTIRGGVAYITGNATKPSVGGAYVQSMVEPVAEAVGDMGDKVRRMAESNAVIEKLVEEAKEIAGAVNQYFWHRSSDPDNDGAGTGAFVTDVTQEEFLAKAALDFPDVSDSKPYHNILMTSVGFLLRSAKKNLVALSRSATTFYDGLGNAASNVVAYFGRDGARIGTSDSFNVKVSSSAVSINEASNPLMKTSIDEYGNAEVRLGDQESYNVSINAGDSQYFGVRWFNGSDEIGAIHILESSGFRVYFEDSDGDTLLINQNRVFLKSDDSVEVSLGHTMYQDGDGIYASHDGSIIGRGLIPLNSNGTVVGTYNTGNDNSAKFVVGIGTSNRNRVDGLVLDDSGNLTVHGQINAGLTTSAVTRQGVTTAGDFDVSYNGVTITVSGVSLRLSEALASGSNVVLGKIDTAAYRPPSDMYAIMATSNTSFAGRCMVRIMSNGNVLLYNASGSSLGTGVNVNFSVTWSI